MSCFLSLAVLFNKALPFVGDMWRGEKEGEAEPDWVKGEREQFSTYRDKNADGHMDHDEVKDWLLPSDYDHSKAEANHLIYESDKNKVRNPSWGCFDCGSDSLFRAKCREPYPILLSCRWDWFCLESMGREFLFYFFLFFSFCHVIG